MSGVKDMFNRYLPVERTNNLLLMATVLLVVWTSFELLFTRIWSNWLPIVPTLLGYASEGLLMLMMAVVIFHPDIGRKRLLERLKNPLNTSLLIFFVFALFSMFVNNVPFAQGVFGVRALFQYLILFFILLAIEIPEQWVKRLFHIILGLGVIQAVIGMYEILFKIPLPLRDMQERRSVSIGEEIRAFGLMDSSNTLGGYLVAILLLLAIYVFIYRSQLSRKQMLIYGGIGLVLLAGLGFTFSRQAFLAMIGCFGLVGLIFRKNKAFRVMLYGAIGLLVVFVIGYGLALFFLEGFAQRNANTFDLSSNYRYLIVLSGLLVLTFSPVFGVGPGMFGSNAAFVFDSKMHQFMHEDLPTTMTTVDNNALYVLVEYGVVGVILLGLIFVAIFKTMAKIISSGDSKQRWIGLFIITFSVAWILMGTLSTAWENQQIALFFWLFLGIAVNWYKRDKTTEE
ncbi:O-antigen ligase domain-containing protein [Salibacterium salarium]|uniref:O-antigen ligase domain-containing protein n=1 Tax=Salibacterium salarium TaxID=284579 RepID=A0A428N5V6_9BACI|nr:O-antigen ligase family protein [Salibacterium salarium]RSL33649.1 O-antigen ligase domain-containing protein [Salibacterium salarium]